MKTPNFPYAGLRFLGNWLFAVGFLSLPLPDCIALAAGLTVSSVSCEYVSNPLGVDIAQPRLFWKLTSPERSQAQSAYRILVASSREILDTNRGDIWDSAKVDSPETVQILYGGKALESSQRVFWKVKVWDREGQESAWSNPGTWTMGLLRSNDWKASWITSRQAPPLSKNTTSPASATTSSTGTSQTPSIKSSQEAYLSLLLRREFHVRPDLKRAVIHVSGLGHYELTANGRKAHENILSPGWSKYDRTVLYDTYDITALLHKGTNAVGLVLGNGMYNVRGGRYVKFKGSFGPQKVIALVHLEYADGSVDEIGTDPSWRVRSGPITFSCVYGGEDFDARIDPLGWDKSGFDASSWETAIAVEGPGGQLRGLSCAAAPIRAFETLEPIKVTSLRPGVSVYDLGQNASLIPRISVTGPAGAVVRITPAELLKPDGSVDRGSVGGGEAYWQYTLAGHGAETWFPKFYYHGCRYLQVECTSPAGQDSPKINSLQGIVVHSSSPAVGTFECSEPLFNRIHQLIRWAQRSNMMSVMTDCPHREKLGWLEEYHLNGPALRYGFDLSRLFAKGMNDMNDSQRDTGLIPDIAPEYVRFDGGFVDSPEWGSAFILVPWQQYEFTGDVGLMRNYYAPMKRYVAYLANRSTDDIVSHGLGDWYDIGPKPPGVAQLTPIPLTATALYYYDTWILSRIAALLGETVEADQFARKAEQIRTAFNEKFYNASTGNYATGSQCANAIPLVMNIADPANRQRIVNNLVEDVRRHGNAPTAGDVGYRFLLRALADAGRSDVIFDINHQSEKPGYGYQLNQGATSLTEAWDAGRGSSQNHFMLGQLTEWFYHDLVGISSDPDGPGFRQVVIKPSIVGKLGWVKGSFDSIRGKIVSNWKLVGKQFVMDLEIPPGSTATVFVPSAAPNEITEGGTPASTAKGVSFVRQENQAAVFRIGSGKYSFASRVDF